MPHIIMTINASGEIEIEAVGTKGKACLALTQPLEDALGMVDDRKFKPEYRQADVTINQQINQRR